MRTATDEIISALHDKGYGQLVRYTTRPTSPIDKTVAFSLYTNGRYVLVLHEWKDGGCELYKPVCDSIRTDKTIEAIP